MHRIDRSDGFTLTEVLIVTVIIGILAAIAIVVFLRERNAAHGASVRADLHAMATAQESYATDSVSSGGPLYATAAEIAAIGRPGVSTDDEVFVYTSDQGYCLVGDSIGTPSYVVYDSQNGGLLPDAVSTLAAAQKVCTDNGYSAAGSIRNDGSGIHVS